MPSVVAVTTSDLINDIIAANNGTGPTTIQLQAADATNGFDFTSAYPSSNDALPQITASITITGTSGFDNTIQRSTASGTPAFRLFEVAGGGSLTLQNLTLTGGLAQGTGTTAEGGAVYSTGTLNLTGVAVQSNQAKGTSGANAAGGGLYVAGGALTLTGDTLQNNQALGAIGIRGGAGSAMGTAGGGGEGGGLFVAAGTVSLSNDTLEGNQAVGGSGGYGAPGGAGAGGGLYMAGGTVTLSNDTAKSNKALGANGLSNPGSIIGAVGGAAAYGGGLYVAAGTLTLSGDTLESNQAAGGNGGFSARHHPIAGFVYGGGAGGAGAGGALYLAGGAIALSNNTIESNQATGGGGGGNKNSIGGTGGEGSGGGLCVAAGTVNLNGGDVFSGNKASGGNGGVGSQFKTVHNGSSNFFAGSGGNGGAGAGGGLYVGGGTVTLNDESLQSNQAVGGTGGAVVTNLGGLNTNGSGGAGSGGGLYVGGGTVTLNNDTLQSNQGVGGNPGASYRGGIGGVATGGGLYISSGVTVGGTGTTVDNNTVTPGVNDGTARLADVGANNPGLGTWSQDFIYQSVASTLTDLYVDIVIANLNSGPYTITLAPGTTFDLTVPDNSTDSTNGLPVITGDLTIVGNGDTIERTTGSAAFRLFDVAGGGSLTLDSLTLSGGLAQGAGPAAIGGAISSAGALTLGGVTVQGNVAQGVAGGNASGGGLGVVGGSATLTNVTLSGNKVVGGKGGSGSGGGAGAGGGLFVGGGTVALSNDTINNNVAQGGGGGAGGAIVRVAQIGGTGGVGAGGGLEVAAGTVTLSNDGINNNEALGGAGGTGGTAYLYLVGGAGGTGGAGFGGGLYVAGGSVSLASETLNTNAAKGGNGGNAITGATSYGNGGNGGNGGDAAGGGLYVSAGVTVPGDSPTTIAGNAVTAGAGGGGGIRSKGTNGSNGPAGTTSLIDIAANSTGLGYYLLPGGSATVITSSMSQPVYGQSVTLTADVVGLGAPTGTVTFYDGGTPLVQVTLDASGVATLTTNAFSAGPNDITAVYSGDGNFTGSTSTALTLPVYPAATTTSVGSSLDPSALGQPVTFTATVTAGSPSTATVATGSVQFQIDGVDFGSPVSVNSSGVAVSMPADGTQLPVGPHTITAVYSGAGNFLSSSNVGYPASVSADSPSAYYPLNDPFGTTAQDVSGNGLDGTYTGGITVGLPGPVEGATAVQLDGSTGSISLPAAPFGNYPNINNSTSDSTTNYPLTFEIWFKAAPGSPGGVILGQTGSGEYIPAVMLGTDGKIRTSLFWLGSNSDAITSSTTYNDGNWHLLDTTYDGGTQSLYIDGVLIGTQSFPELYYSPSYSYTLGAGYTAGWAGGNGGNFYYNGELAQAAIYPTALSAAQIAAHAQAADTGDLAQLVSSPTTTVAGSSVSSSTYGQPVTLTATVSATLPGAGTPDSTVTFLDAGTILGTVNLSGGTASLTTSALPAGDHTITVSYAGDGLFDPSTSAAITVTVDQADTTTTITAATPNPSVFGQSVTFTETVAPPFSGTATGTVTFQDGTAPLGTVSLSDGVATFTTSELPIGTDEITASYNGDGNFIVSTSAAAAQSVLPATTTTLNSSANPLTFGQSTTFTATVTTDAPSTATVNAGTVQFLIDGVDFGTPVSVNGSGVAVSSPTAGTQFSPGAHTISAVYSGGSTFGGSVSGDLIQSVIATTNTALSSSVDPSVAGESVTFTATVSAPAGAGTPDGTVTFLDAGVSLGTASLSNGTATLTTALLATGSHTITASYAGDSEYVASTSTAITQTVDQLTIVPGTVVATTTAQLIADINAANAGTGPSTIQLEAADAANGFEFTSVYPSTTDALPPITDAVIIEGTPGFDNTIQRDTASGTPAFRLFEVAAGGSLTLQNLTLSGGLARGTGAAADGGAIYSAGPLTLGGVTVENNSAEGSTGTNGINGAGGNGAAAYGGGVYVAGGAVTLSDDIINLNTVSGGNGGAGGHGFDGHTGGGGGNAAGGGLYVAGGNVTLTNTTLTNNAAVGGNGGNGGNAYRTQYSYGTAGNGGSGGNAAGGGLYVLAGVTVLGDSVTSVSNNAVTAGAGGSGGTALSFVPAAFYGYNGHNGAAGTVTEDDIAANNPDFGNYDVYATTPTVTVADGGTYNGQPFDAAGSAVGADGRTPVSGTFSYTYYASDGVTQLSGAPTTAGRYYVTAAFISGDPNYANATSAETGFTIGTAMPSVTVTDGGAYNGKPFNAVGSAVGIDGQTPVSGSFNYTYFASDGVTQLDSAPTNAGSYFVTAIFSSSDPNYASASSVKTGFTIVTDTPTVTVTDGGTYDGQPFNAVGSVVGADGQTAVSGTFSYTYYASDGVTQMSGAPTTAGSYYVAAAFTSSDPNYASASSAETGFTVDTATPTVTDTDGSAYNGQPLNAAGSAVGIDGQTPVPGSFSYTYYASDGVTQLAGAPMSAGSYFVTSTFTSSDSDYSNATSAKTGFTIGTATPTATVTDGGTYNGKALNAVSSAVGVDGQTPVPGSFSYTYFASDGVTQLSGAPLTAGSYYVTAAFTSSDPNYANATSAETGFSINPLAVTLSGSRSYDSTTGAAADILSITNLVGGDTVTVSGSATLAGTNAGPEAISSFAGLTLGGTAATDYTLTGSSGSVDVTPSAPTLGVTDGGTYTGSPIPATATALGVDGKTTVPGSFGYVYYAGTDTSGTDLGTTAPTNVGTYTVVATFTSSDANYQGGSTQTTFAITPSDAGGTGPGTPSVPATTPSPDLIGFPQVVVGPDAGGPSSVTVYNADGTVATTLTPFPGFTGGIRTAVGDLSGDGNSDVVVGTGPGTTATVAAYNGNTLLFTLVPFESSFTGGVFVTTGSLTGDGRDELIITADEGGGPRVEVYELQGTTPVLVANFFGIDDPNFRGGARATVDGADGSGSTDLVVSAGVGGGPRISVYDGAALLQGQLVHPVADFFAFESTLRNGAYVASGDVNGDGTDDLILGAGPGGAPRVLILDGTTLASQGPTAALADPIANFFAGDPDNRGGVRVVAKNLDDDGYADVVTGNGAGAGSQVTEYLGKDLSAGVVNPDLTLDTFPGFSGGVFVG
ncbi:beta strand repeat-containing protein [Fimbriiglobus ruber]|uniref:NHL repeat containing protein n=1 Tax=Fimbriiglobus ruber TaxID=1908690 RepID=A0A225DNQ3_9BACT|nr:Ig-like domain repeat protein [Fimbriiglobus ruber]OWK39106.1 NHL repeat containing protein [Fimbriiglobus ruber]